MGPCSRTSFGLLLVVLCFPEALPPTPIRLVSPKFPWQEDTGLPLVLTVGAFRQLTAHQAGLGSSVPGAAPG